MAGGCGDEDCFFPLDSAESYDPDSETWRSTGSLNKVRWDIPTLAMLPNDDVLAIGGTGPFSG